MIHVIIFAKGVEFMKKMAALALSCMLCLTPSLVNVHAESYSVNKNEVVQYTLDKGTYVLTLKSDATAYGELFTSESDAKAGTGSSVVTNSYVSVDSTNTSKTKIIKVTKGDEYYLSLNSNDDSTKVEASIDEVKNGGTLTLNKTMYGSSNGNNEDVSYYKLKLANSGLIDLSLAGYYGGASYIKVCNSKKKSISGSWMYAPSNSKLLKSIGLKKGTYYIAVKSYEDVYSIQASFSKLTKLGGSKKSTATSLKKSKTVKSLSLQSGSTSWFKYKNPKEQKLSLVLNGKTFKGGSNGGLKITCYAGKTKLGSQTFRSSYYETGNVFNITHSNRDGYANKGTYYFKITTYKTGSGYYTLSLK